MPPASHQLRSPDVDALVEAAAGWDLDFRPLASGQVDLEMLSGEGAQTIRVGLAGPMRQEGASPPGCRTFGVIDPGVAFRWCGRTVDEGVLVLKPRDGGFEADSRPGFRVTTISLAEPLLEEAAREQGLPELDDLLPREGAAIRAPEVRLRRLRTELDALHAAPDAGWPRLLHEIPGLLLDALDARPAQAPPEARLRDRALARALEYVHAHARGAPSVEELARAAGTSVRTLRYAFQERYGISPKRYLHALRLNGVRRDLRRADPSVARVGDLASRWGFWHLGQFAADYRLLFGELPSRTLRR